MDENGFNSGEQGGLPGAGPPQTRPPERPAEDSEVECAPPGRDPVAWCRTKVKSVGWGKVIAAGLIGALVVLLVLPVIFGVNPYDLVRGKVKNAGQVQKVTTVVSPSGGSTDVSTVARNVTGSIVNIDVRLNPPQNTTTATPTIGSGSGVIVRQDGYIITNNHLVGSATAISVTMPDGKKFTGTVVGTHPAADIAVVKINASGLKPATMGDSDRLVVGQLVVAIGSPLGFQQTVTSGIISALYRSVQAQNDTGQTETLNGLIQTDAPINPGNSGGALCDSSSRVIGINAVIATQSGTSSGIAFAIPSNTAVTEANAIIGGRP